MFPLDQLDAKTELVEELAAYTCFLNEAYLKAARRKPELAEFTKFIDDKMTDKLSNLRKTISIQADAQKYFEKWLSELAAKYFAQEVVECLFGSELSTGIDKVHSLIARTEVIGGNI